MLPEPVIEQHGSILVVRDDRLPGGTKRRAMHTLMSLPGCAEYVYASPVYGYAQLALAHAARDYGHRATIFCAKRKTYHPLTEEALSLGATVIEVPMGFLTVVQARAREYCDKSGAVLLPFGLDAPVFIDALADVARRLLIVPTEVWSITSSGVLTRALQQAWPLAAFFGVQVGAVPDAGRATVYRAPEAFDRPAKHWPPFPSSVHYDAKAWQFIQRHASPGALFWNVA